MLKACVDFGLSMTDIRDFSMTWPQPITTIQQVSDKVKSLGLRTTFERRNRKRIGPHNQAINNTFIRLAGQTLEQGWMVEKITRERKVFDFSPVRPDFYFEAVKGKRREAFCFEVQAAKTEFTLWGKKLSRYVQAYKELKQMQSRKDDGINLFRVPIMVHSPDELTRARQEARRVLSKSGHEGLNLFLFALITDVERRYTDVVSREIWRSAWNGQNRWTLLP